MSHLSLEEYVFLVLETRTKEERERLFQRVIRISPKPR